MSSAPPAKLSTSDIKTQQFNAHGVVDIWKDGDLIHYQATGPFNAELIDLLAIAQRDFLLDARPTGAWVSIGTMLRSAMTSPEGIARYAAIMAAPKPDGMVPIATAFVMAPEVEGYLIMAAHYARIFKDIGRTFQIFKSLPEAEAWARGLLAEAAQRDV